MACTAVVDGLLPYAQGSLSSPPEAGQLTGRCHGRLAVMDLSENSCFDFLIAVVDYQAGHGPAWGSPHT